MPGTQLCPDDHAVSRFLAPPSAQNGTSSTTDAYAHDVAGMKEDWVEREKVRALKLRLLADVSQIRNHNCLLPLASLYVLVMHALLWSADRHRLPVREHTPPQTACWTFL